MFSVSQSGNYDGTLALIDRGTNQSFSLDQIGQAGVDALRQATPVETGEAASSWSYTIEQIENAVTIEWVNDEMAGSVPLVVLLQYGHATINGGYVQGLDFINPALRYIFMEVANYAISSVINGNGN